MLTFQIIFLSLNLFRYTQSRVCLGISGLVCCDGYWLNQTTGLCQKCPLGYFLNNCSIKCSPPNYGEECQSLCQCPFEECHFATGCLQDVETVSVYQRLNSTRGNAARYTTLTVTSSNLTVSYGTEKHAISTDVNNNDVTQMTYLPTEIDLFKNDKLVHVFQIIVSFIGVFVIVFTIFVITYIYMKCFRRSTNESEIHEHQIEAQYKSLSFSRVEPESQTQPGPQEQTNAACTYLTPVFRERGSSDNSHTDENIEIIQETSFKRQQNCYKPANGSNFISDVGSTNVYMEITQDNI